MRVFHFSFIWKLGQRSVSLPFWCTYRCMYRSMSSRSLIHHLMYVQINELTLIDTSSDVCIDQWASANEPWCFESLRRFINLFGRTKNTRKPDWQFAGYMSIRIFGIKCWQKHGQMRTHIAPFFHNLVQTYSVCFLASCWQNSTWENDNTFFGRFQ